MTEEDHSPRPGLYADGTWQSSAGDGLIESRSAADGTLLDTFLTCDAEDVGRAVDAADRAAKALAALPVSARSDLLRALADELEEVAERMAERIAWEVGTPVALSRRLQVGLPVGVLREYADAAERVAWSERIGHSEVVHRPVGVVGAMTPWNYPLHQIVMKLGAAFAAGCPLVLKPAEIALGTLPDLVDALERAGFPPGAFNVVMGGAGTGQALVAHEGVRHVSFTGSSAVGALVGQAAAARLVPITLELGGKSPSVILDGADLERAVKSSVGNAFLNSGQTCTAWSRLIVPRERHGQVLELACEAAGKLTIGHPMEASTRLGPVATAAQVDTVERLMSDAGDRARVVFESTLSPDLPKGGHYVPARIVDGVDPGSGLARQEVFGPVLSVFTYRTVEEAIHLANSSDYGLTAAVWGEERAAESVAGQIEAGMVDINGAAFNPAGPFGGWKASGYGRELGAFGIREFTHPQSIQRRVA